MIVCVISYLREDSLSLNAMVLTTELNQHENLEQYKYAELVYCILRLREAGVKKIRFHDLRHTHATFLLKIGINPKGAADRLGMTPAMFNKRYSHLFPTCRMRPLIESNELNKHAEKSLEPTPY